MKKILPIAAILMLAAPVMAAVELTWTITQVDDNLYKVIGTATSVNDACIGGIDVGNAAAPGIRSADVDGALFLQDWFYNAVPTPSLTSAIPGQEVPEVDTHFLFSGGLTIPDGGELEEGGPGWGTWIAGTFGISPALYATSVDFIQIYATEGYIDYTIQLANQYGDTSPWYVSSIYVPEPTTLVLLGVGGLMALRRRRCA